MIEKNSISCLVRPQPQPSESLPGYVLRLSELNAYIENPSLFSYLFATPFYFSPSRDGMKRLSELFEVEPTRLSEMVFQTEGPWHSRQGTYCGHPLFKHHMRRHGGAICSKCLEDYGFIFSSWSFGAITACSRHGIWLNDTCPQCQTRLQWRRPGVCKCNCGFDLRHSPVNTAPELIVDQIKMIEAALSTKRERQPLNVSRFSGRIDEITFTDWNKFHQIVQRFFSRSEANTSAEYSFGSTDLQKECYASFFLGYALKIWPDITVKLLNHYQEAKEEEKVDLVIPYSELEARYGNPHIRSSRDTLATCSVPSVIQKLLFQYADNGVWKEDQQKLCLDPNKVLSFYTGDLRVRTSAANNSLIRRYGCKARPFDNKDDISLAEFMHKKALVTQRNLGLHEVHRLLKASCSQIQSIKARIEVIGLKGRYCPERIAELISSLKEKAILIEDKSKKENKRLRALARINTNFYLFEKIVSAILDNKICLYRCRSAESLSDFFVPVKDLWNFHVDKKTKYFWKTLNATCKA